MPHLNFQKENIDKRNLLILGSIFLTGIVFRLFLFIDTSFIGSDAASYARLGKNLVESGSYVFGENYNWGIFFPPGFPLLTGSLNLLFNDLFFSGKLVSLFSGLITIFLIYLTAARIYSRKAGLFAAFAFAVHPMMLKISTTATSESLFICLLTLSLYLTTIAVEEERGDVLIFLGLTIGMAYLTRPEGFLLLLMPVMAMVAIKTPIKKIAIRYSVVVIVFILVASPYMLFLKNSTGKLSLSGKSSYLAYLMENGVEGSHRKYDKVRYELDEEYQIIAFNASYKSSNVTDLITRDFPGFLKKYFMNILLEAKMITKMSLVILLPLVILLISGNMAMNRHMMIILYPSIFLFIYPIFFIDERQVLLTVPSLVLLSSAGFESVHKAALGFEHLFGKKKADVLLFLERSIKFIVFFVLIAGSLILFVRYGRTVVPTEHIELGTYIRNNISSEYEELNIMSRMPWTSFYSGARFSALPYADTDDVVEYAKRYDVDYIVIDERLIGEWDHYGRLISMDAQTDEVELVYINDSEPLIKLFRVKY